MLLRPDGFEDTKEEIVEAHIQETFVKEKAKLKEMLSSVRWVSWTIGGRTIDSHISFLGITVHWIDDEWMLREHVWALEKLEGNILVST